MHLPTYHVESEFQGNFTARRTATDILVHHAAAMYPHNAGIEDVRAVATYHRSKGWSGIGYHVVLAEEVQHGPIARYHVSDLDLQRAHIAWRNHEFVGLSCLTNFDATPHKLPAQKWIDALVTALADLLERYPNAHIYGHTEKALDALHSPDHGDYRTACPGSRWHDWKNDLLVAVQQERMHRSHATVPPWDGWGDMYPLAQEQYTWGIPQTWIANGWLGQARSGEQWSPDGLACVQWFQAGYIVYEKHADSTHVYHRDEPVP